MGASARRLADEVAPEIRVVYCAHCLRPAVPPRLLGELVAAGEEVAADCGHFSIVLPLSAPGLHT